MKVLAYKDNNPNLPTMQVSCTGRGIHNDRKPCGALLEVNALDIERATHTDYGGGTETYYRITCPECGVKTEILEKDIPKEIFDCIN